MVNIKIGKFGCEKAYLQNVSIFMNAMYFTQTRGIRYINFFDKEIQVILEEENNFDIFTDKNNTVWLRKI